MPPARKPTGQRVVSGGRQATLSFHHRVTKASVPKPSAKESIHAVAKKVNKTEERDTAKPAKPVDDVSEKEETVSELEAQSVAETSLTTSRAPAKSELEIEAEAVSKAQIQRYWRGIEAQRTAPRVHQKDLDLGEQVLRYFDVSSQFGPCVGITRKKRWLRAHRLGLSPPIEVLAVLLDEEAHGARGIERASIDAILNPTVVV